VAGWGSGPEEKGGGGVGLHDLLAGEWIRDALYSIECESCKTVRDYRSFRKLMSEFSDIFRPEDAGGTNEIDRVVDGGGLIAVVFRLEKRGPRSNQCFNFATQNQESQADDVYARSLAEGSRTNGSANRRMYLILSLWRRVIWPTFPPPKFSLKSTPVAKVNGGRRGFTCQSLVNMVTVLEISGAELVPHMYCTRELAACNHRDPHSTTSTSESQPHWC